MTRPRFPPPLFTFSRTNSGIPEKREKKDKIGSRDMIRGIFSPQKGTFFRWPQYPILLHYNTQSAALGAERKRKKLLFHEEERWRRVTSAVVASFFFFVKKDKAVQQHCSKIASSAENRSTLLQWPGLASKKNILSPRRQFRRTLLRRRLKKKLAIKKWREGGGSWGSFFWQDCKIEKMRTVQQKRE